MSKTRSASRAATLTEKPWAELHKILSERGLSVAELCRMSGVTYQSLLSPMLGYRRPSDRVIRAAAAALQVSPETITPRGACNATI